MYWWPGFCSPGNFVHRCIVCAVSPLRGKCTCPLSLDAVRTRGESRKKERGVDTHTHYAATLFLTKTGRRLLREF